MRDSKADIATRSHTHGGTGWPEIIGSRLGIGEQFDADYHLAPRHSDHDYTYGLSKTRLRPTGPFLEDEDDYRDGKAGRAPNPARPRRTRPVQHVPESEAVPLYRLVQPVIYGERRRIRYRVREGVHTTIETVSGNVRLSGVDIEELLDDVPHHPATGIDWQ